MFEVLVSECENIIFDFEYFCSSKNQNFRLRFNNLPKFYHFTNDKALYFLVDKCTCGNFHKVRV